jgi:carbon monoxide dehydrogenase subunit G
MKISGTSTLEAPVEKVWDAILDPAVLARCIPGCEALSTIGEDRYAMSVTAGVAAIKGTYAGEVSLADKVAPHSLTMKASGAGAPGTIDADVKVSLVQSLAGGTELSYDADATIGGAIGGVGQRMLTGVTKKMAGQFFLALDQDIAGVLVPAGATTALGAPLAGGEGTASSPTVYAGRAVATGKGALDLGAGAGFALGALVGGLLALAGVALGARIGRGPHALRGRR